MKEFAYTVQKHAHFINEQGYHCIFPVGKWANDFKKYPHTYAIKKEGTRNNYFIRLNQISEIFDPYNPDHLRSSQRTIDGVQYWRWVETTDVGFEAYLDYLTHNNNNFMRKARHEYNNKLVG